MVERARSVEQGGLGFDIDRRRLLKRTAVVGGALWAAPALLTVDRASAAELHSAPPAGGTPRAEVRGSAVDRPTAASQPSGTRPMPAAVGQTGAVGAQGIGGSDEVAAPALVRTGTLPRTGGDIDKLVGTGLAAVAGGGLLHWWSADRAALGAPAADVPAAPAD